MVLKSNLKEIIQSAKKQGINDLATLCTANGISENLTRYKSSFSQRNKLFNLKNNVDKEYEDLYSLSLFNFIQKSGGHGSIVCFDEKKKF